MTFRLYKVLQRKQYKSKKYTHGQRQREIERKTDYVCVTGSCHAGAQRTCDPPCASGRPRNQNRGGVQPRLHVPAQGQERTRAPAWTTGRQTQGTPSSFLGLVSGRCCSLLLCSGLAGAHSLQRTNRITKSTNSNASPSRNHPQATRTSHLRPFRGEDLFPSRIINSLGRL